MADLTLRAEEVVGRPWCGVEMLCVEAYETDDEAWRQGARARVVEHHEMAATMYLPGDGLRARPMLPAVWWTDLHRWAVILDDPRGLGLAGLAAGVAERLRWDDLMEDACDLPSLVTRLRLRSWYSGPAIGLREIVVWASSYLALTDRLCALLGLELEPGEVAGWRQLYEGGAWELSAGKLVYALFEAVDSKHEPFAARIVPSLEGTTNPLTALRAAVAALEDQHG